MSVVVAVRDEDKIWLATDSQVTAGWTKSLLLSQHSFKIFKGRNKVNIGGVGSLRDLNIISTSDVDFISENDILKNNVNFKNMVRETVPKFFAELQKFNRVYSDHGMLFMESSFIIAHGDSCYAISSDGCVQELYDMFAIGSGAEMAESAYTILRDVELSPKDKAIRAVMSSCERDIFVDYPIVITNTLIDNFEVFDGQNLYEIHDGIIEDTSDDLEEATEEDKEDVKKSPEGEQAIKS